MTLFYFFLKLWLASFFIYKIFIFMFVYVCMSVCHLFGCWSKSESPLELKLQMNVTHPKECWGLNSVPLEELNSYSWISSPASIALFSVAFFFFCSARGWHKALYILGKHSTTDLQHQKQMKTVTWVSSGRGCNYCFWRSWGVCWLRSVFWGSGNVLCLDLDSD